MEIFPLSGTWGGAEGVGREGSGADRARVLHLPFLFLHPSYWVYLRDTMQQH